MENEQNKIYVNTEDEDEDEDEKPKKNIEENTKPRCSKICAGWFLQILILPALAFLIFSCIKQFKGWKYVIFGFIFIYAMYLYQFLNANSIKFLSNISNSEGIYKILEKNFTQPPEINVDVRCYHSSVNSSRSTRRSVTTFKKKFIFPYYSWKDISGLFLLKQDKTKKYPFLRLYLKSDINFADSISYSDFTIYKNALREKYEKYDSFFSIHDDKIIPDFEEFYLIPLDPNNIPCCISKGLYIFFSIFFLGQFYKTYFQKKCYAQNFTIRKIVSTRYDVTNNQNYYQMEPGYKYNEKLVVFERKNTEKINEDFQLIQPNQDELNNANQYNNYIPNYQIINVGEQIAIVQDSQHGSNLNNNPVIISDTINVGKNNN